MRSCLHHRVCLILATLFFFVSVKAQVSIPSGSYIIDMGVNTTSKPNGLRPYGMIHELVKFYNVPILWVVKDNKVKDAVDYTIEGFAYKGGLFIIPGNYVTTPVATAITGWTTGTPASTNGYTRGGVTARTISASYTFSGALVETLKSVPKWTMDAQNGGISVGFLTNAGIPASAYDWKTPAQLGECSDIFVMPHADPKWATHGNLYSWNETYKGAIWLGCHAGSALENMYNPANTSEQTNFLSTKATTAGTGITLPVSGSTAYAQNSLVLWGAHSSATIPYNTNTAITAPQTGTFAPADDWVSQFIGVTDLAHLNGSEQVYLPVLGQQWRPTTNIITYDPTQANVPANSPGAAVIIAYGPGLGDPNRGSVMLEAGHSINKGTAGDVPAQRAFFNWSFLSSKAKAISVGDVVGVPSSGQLYGSTNLSVTASSPVATSGSLSYTWTCIKKSDGSSIGSFSPNGSNAASSTTFTLTGWVASATDVIFSVSVTDPCGRSTISSYAAKLMPAAAGPVANPDVATISATCYTPGTSTTISVLSNDTDADNDLNTSSVVLINPANSGQTGTSYTIANTGTWTTNGTTVTFAPADNFFGSASITYKVCDNTNPTPLCATSTVTVGVGTADANGCYPGTVWGIASETFATAANPAASSVTNAASATGTPDYDPTDNTTYAEINASGDILYLDFGSVISATSFDSVVVYFASGTAATSTTMRVDYSTDNSTYTQLGTVATTSNDPGAEIRYRIPASGLRYLKITRSAGSANLWVDAATVEDWSCVADDIIAMDDAVSVLEDNPTKIEPLANDDFAATQKIKLTIISLPTNGRVSINTDNTITYVNNTDSRVADAFTYKICTPTGICDEATVNVSIISDGCAAGSYKSSLTGTPVTVTLSGAGTIDTYLRENSGDSVKNYGGADELRVKGQNGSRERSLIKFNLPAAVKGTNALIDSASLSLYLDANAASEVVAVHRVTKTWLEGTGGNRGSSGGTGPTWSRNQHTPAIYWTNGGGDYDQTSEISSINVGTATKVYKNWNVKTYLQQVANGLPDSGMIVKRSSESASGTFKEMKFLSTNKGGSTVPKLYIRYIPIAPCSAIPNRAPLAMPDEVSTTTSTATSLSPLTTDGDVDAGTTLSVTAATRLNTSAGTISLSGNVITYTPNFSLAIPRTDTLLYTVSDGSLTDQAYIYVRVENSAPKLGNDLGSGNSGSSIAVDVNPNDSDTEGSALSAPAVTVAPVNGSYTISGTTITYTPNAGFYGTDVLTYQRCETTVGGCNNAALCSTATVTFTVANRPPTVTNKSVSLFSCQTTTINLLDYISDPEGERMTITITSGTTSGDVTTLSNGNTLTKADYGIYTFTAGTAASTQTINFTATDPAGGVSNIGTITVTINSPAANNAPTAVNDLFSTATYQGIGAVNEDIYVDVMDNDSDQDGDQLGIQLTNPGEFTSFVTPSSGTVAIFNGMIRYTPNPGFTGIDAFDYILFDDFETVSGGCTQPTRKYAKARVTVRVIGAAQEIPLPLNWLSFTAKAQSDRSVLLVWQTANEINTKDFMVERSNNNQSNWTTIGTVMAAGSGDNQYRFNDKNPGADAVFYRIRQRDIDQKSSFSVVRFVRFTADREFASIRPNPARQLTNLNLQGKSTDRFLVQLFDPSGVKLSAQYVNAGTLPIDMSRHASGMYMIQVLDLQTGDRQLLKLIKQ